MKKKEILASESFSATDKRHYFLDFKRAENDSRYIQLTRSEQQPDGSYKRWSFVVFENHLEDFISAFASLFQSAAYQGRGYQTLREVAEESRVSKGIKAMPEDTRPREKLFAHGANKINNAELLAILLGSGSPGESAIELAGRILEGMGGKIHMLKSSSYSSLCSFKGMGVAKASSVLAAVELARRLYSCPPPEFKTVYIVRKPGDDDPLLFKSN
ncbi:MAG: UPF0758 domain-containing protein [Bacteroidota bacterium]